MKKTVKLSQVKQRAAWTRQLDSKFDIALLADIEKNGLQNPITVDKNLRIIDGERRYNACKTLGHETVEVVEKQ